MVPEVTYILCPITDIFISRFLYTLYKYSEPNTFKVIVIDQCKNQFRKEVMDYIMPLTHLYMHPKRNLGFAKGMNEGVLHALHWKSELICMSNDDIEIINKDWMNGIRKTFELDKRIMGVVPMSPKVAGWGYGVPTYPELIPYKKEFTEEDYQFLIKGDFSSIHHMPKTYPTKITGTVVDGSAFIMPYFKRECLEKIGLFDEHYFPGCFLPDEQVLMGNMKYKSIKDIQPEEYVFGKYGKRCPVLANHKKPYKGKVLELSFVGTSEKIRLTPDHKVFSVSRTGNKGKRSVCWSRKKKEIKEVEAKNLQVKDLVYCPVLSTGNAAQLYTIEQFRIYGYFLAEGNYIKKMTKKGKKLYGLSFTFNINEKEYIREVTEFFKSEGISFRVYDRPKKTTSTVEVYSKTVAEKFFELFGEYSYGKSISRKVLLREEELIRNLVLAYINGDGCMAREFKQGKSKKYYEQIAIKSNSWNLLRDIRTILIRLGIPSLLYQKEKASQLYISQTYFNRLYGLPEQKENKRNEVFEENGRIYYPIKDIKEIDYEGDVYDLEVAIDHSYIVGIMTVHNSGEDYDYTARCYRENLRFVSTSLSWVWHHWSKSKNLFASGEIEDEYYKPEDHPYWNNMGDLYPPAMNEGEDFDVWGFYHKEDENGNDVKVPLKRVDEIFVDQI